MDTDEREKAREAAEQRVAALEGVVADAERMYASLAEVLCPYKLPIESLVQPTAIVPRLIERMEKAEAERDALKEVLEKIRDRLPDMEWCSEDGDCPVCDCMDMASSALAASVSKKKFRRLSR